MRIIVYIWPDKYLCNVTVLGKLCFYLVYMHYTHPSYRTSNVGKNCAYYIRIFTVLTWNDWVDCVADTCTLLFSVSVSFCSWPYRGRLTSVTEFTCLRNIIIQSSFSTASHWGTNYGKQMYRCDRVSNLTFFPKSEIRHILKIWLCQIQFFFFRPTLQLFSQITVQWLVEISVVVLCYSDPFSAL